MRILHDLLQVIVTVNSGLGVCLNTEETDTMKLMFLYPHNTTTIHVPYKN
jgi:hypothetical protein